MKQTRQSTKRRFKPRDAVGVGTFDPIFLHMSPNKPKLLQSAVAIGIATVGSIVLLYFESKRSHGVPASSHEFAVMIGVVAAALGSQCVIAYMTQVKKIVLVWIGVSIFWLSMLSGLHVFNVYTYNEDAWSTTAMRWIRNIREALKNYQDDHGHLPDSPHQLIFEKYLDPTVVIISQSGTTMEDICIGEITLAEWIRQQSYRPSPVEQDGEWYKLGDYYFARSPGGHEGKLSQILVFSKSNPFSEGNPFIEDEVWLLRRDWSIDKVEEGEKILEQAREQGIVKDSRCR